MDTRLSHCPARAMADEAAHEIAKIQAVAAGLAGLPQRDVQISKRQTVRLLIGEIQSARDKGYTLEQIAAYLKSQGLNISLSTLKKYLPRRLKPRSCRKKLPPVTARDNGSGQGGLPRGTSGDHSGIKPASGNPPSLQPTGGRFVPTPDSDIL